MKTIVTTLAAALVLSVYSGTVSASMDKGISKDEVAKIKAACVESSRDAVNPAWYAEECVEDKLVALKEERGLLPKRVPEQKEGD